jgi:hypothetical protein
MIKHHKTKILLLIGDEDPSLARQESTVSEAPLNGEKKSTGNE